MNGHEQGQQSRAGCAARRPLLLGFSLLFPLVLLVFSLILAYRGALGSTNLLTNGGFEDGTTGWMKFPGDAIFVSVTHPVHGGDWAASLNREGLPGEIRIYQNVDVVAGAIYTLTGCAYNSESSFNEVCLRIKWLYTGYPDEVSSCLDGVAADYRPITVSSATAPPDATTARIMAVADILSPNPPNPVYFDDLSFTSNMPPTPTPISVYVPLVFKGYR
jgi:hypothetical protein